MDTQPDITCLGYDNQGGDPCREQKVSFLFGSIAHTQMHTHIHAHTHTHTYMSCEGEPRVNRGIGQMRLAAVEICILYI